MMFLFVFTTMPVMRVNVGFNVQIQVIQLIQIMQVGKCRVHCSVVGTNVLKCVFKDASHGVTGAM